MTSQEILYRINDMLSALKSELNVRFDSEEEEDRVLNDLTHEVADKFGVKETS